MSNSRENREQDARAGSFDVAQATASGGMVAVVGVILLASWFLKAEPRRAPASASSSGSTAASMSTASLGATAPSAPSVLAPLTPAAEEPKAPPLEPSMEPPADTPETVPHEAPIPLATPEPMTSNPIVARALRDAGRLASHRGAFVAQVAAVCNEELVAARLQKLGESDRFYILPVTIKERSCYRMLWGTYDSAAAAARADLPAALRSSDKVRVVPVHELLP